MMLCVRRRILPGACVAARFSGTAAGQPPAGEAEVADKLSPVPEEATVATTAANVSAPQAGRLASDGFPMTGAEAEGVREATDAESAVRVRAADGVATQRAKAKAKKEAPPLPRYKVKKKAPWGHRQLRDMWSTDAMSRHDNDSVGERLDREYRYHPENAYRKHFKFFGILGLCATPLGMVLTHYAVYGYPIWQGDPQFLFDMVRFHDTSPRSHLYFFHDPEVKKLGVPLPLQEQQAMLEKERKQLTAVANIGGFSRPSSAH